MISFNYYTPSKREEKVTTSIVLIVCPGTGTLHHRLTQESTVIILTKEYIHCSYELHLQDECHPDGWEERGRMCLMQYHMCLKAYHIHTF